MQLRKFWQDLRVAFFRTSNAFRAPRIPRDRARLMYYFPRPEASDEAERSTGVKDVGKARRSELLRVLLFSVFPAVAAVAFVIVLGAGIIVFLFALLSDNVGY